MTRLSNLGRATFLTLSSSFALFPFVFSNPASASSSNSSSETTEHKTVLVTASRLNEDSASSSANVTIITADEIRDSAASNLVDLLGTKAGINTRSLYGGSKYADVGLRGFGVSDGQNTLVLLDGRRLNELDLAGVTFSSIPLDNIERIEIVRGGGSVLYGDGAVGGVINIITKAAEPGVSKGKVHAEYGSYQHRALGISGKTGNERTSVHTYLERNLNDGYRSNNAYEQVTGAVDLRHYLDSAELYLKAGGNDYDIGLPGARRRNPALGIDEIGRDPQGATTPDDVAKEQSGNLVLGSAIDLGDNKQLILDLGYRTKDQEAHYYQFGASQADAKLKDVSFTPRWIGQIGKNTRLTLGIDQFATDYNSFYQSGFGDSHYDIEVESMAYYASAQQTLNDRTVVDYGVRMQNISYFAVDDLGANPDAGETFREPSYELGLTNQFAPDYALYLRYSRAVRLVTVDEMDAFMGNFGILKPQRSNQFETGLNARWDKSHGRLSVYTMALTNEIAYDPMLWDNRNLEPTQRRGVELELGTEFESATSIDFSYTYQQATFREGAYEGKRVPLVPSQNSSLALGQSLSESLKVSALLNHTGRYYMDNDQLNATQRASSYTTLDFKLALKLTPLDLQLALNNVFDRKGYSYAIRGATPGAFDAYPLPDRNANIRLSYDF